LRAHDKLSMNSTEEFVAHLSKWQKASTPLFFQSMSGGVTTWCFNGVLHHASSAELHFGLATVDGRDLLFVVNVHSARFRWVDNREAWQFFSVGRSKTVFGLVLEIMLKPGAKVIIAEQFREAIEVSSDR
jgi:hypothetical protein